MENFGYRMGTLLQQLVAVCTHLKPKKTDVISPKYRTVTPEAAGSSPVTPAIYLQDIAENIAYLPPTSADICLRFGDCEGDVTCHIWC
jgi:hypothetical protein